MNRIVLFSILSLNAATAFAGLNDQVILQGPSASGELRLELSVPVQERGSASKEIMAAMSGLVSFKTKGGISYHGRLITAQTTTTSDRRDLHVYVNFEVSPKESSLKIDTDKGQITLEGKVASELFGYLVTSGATVVPTTTAETASTKFVSCTQPRENLAQATCVLNLL